MIDHQNKFIYVPIPKTASQAIVSGLNLDNIPEPALYHNTLEHFISEDYKKHINYYKFSIVRNPWDKLASLWRDFTIHRKKQYSAQHTANEYLFSQFNNFEDLCLNLKDSFWSQNVFFRPQVYFLCYAGQMTVDYIGRFEKLASSYEEICTKIGINPKKLNIINSTMSHTRDPKHYRSLYNNKTSQAIHDFYHLDIKTFKYEF